MSIRFFPGDGTEEKIGCIFKPQIAIIFGLVIDELIGEYAYLTSLDNVLFFIPLEKCIQWQSSQISLFKTEHLYGMI